MAALSGALALATTREVVTTRTIQPIEPPVSQDQSVQLLGAAICRECHTAIYDEWRASWMAAAYSNAVFQTEFQRWQTLAPDLGEEPLDCLRCHAPGVLISRIPEQRETLANEGVTCEICHRTGQATLTEDRANLALDPRRLIYGTRDIVGAPHHVVANPTLRDPALCAGCHLDRHGEVYMERTFQEWQTSPYAVAGVVCADCHMPSAPGPATNGTDAESHAAHYFPGGHAGSPLLADVVSLEILELGPEGARIVVSNDGVGHNFPTGGAHDTRLRLIVEGSDDRGEVMVTRTVAFSLDMLREDGGMAGPQDLVVSVSDTTLAPQERRDVALDWSVERAPARLSVRLVYDRFVKPPEGSSANPAFARAVSPTEMAACALTLTPGWTRMAESCHAEGRPLFPD